MHDFMQGKGKRGKKEREVEGRRAGLNEKTQKYAQT